MLSSLCGKLSFELSLFDVFLYCCFFFCLATGDDYEESEDR